VRNRVYTLAQCTHQFLAHMFSVRFSSAGVQYMLSMFRDLFKLGTFRPMLRPFYGAKAKQCKAPCNWSGK
jgi:hypothetical protein